jgi:hypothetical protein
VHSSSIAIFPASSIVRLCTLFFLFLRLKVLSGAPPELRCSELPDSSEGDHIGEPAARGVAIALARRRLGRGGDSRGFSSPSERQEKQQREMSG